MNKKLLFAVIMMLTFGFVNAQVKHDTVVMQAGYTNDVYYSLKLGEKGNVARANWDIAFKTDPFSASILTNNVTGVELYSYPNGDTADWSTLDTAGLSTWAKMFNSDTTWEQGAFCRYEQGHPDYGWGKYNMVNHSVVGDSIFVIKLTNGSWKKFQIIKKDAVANTFYFKYADLNGSNLHVDTFDVKPYISKSFVYFDLVNNQMIDREPASKEWDMVFTRYYNIAINYLVTGVLTQQNVEVAAFKKVHDTAFTAYQITDLDSNHINLIGSDWKKYSSTAGYVIVDSMVYFLSDQESSIYKLVFESFTSTTGSVGFRIEKLFDGTGIYENKAKTGFTSIYPNPAADNFNVITKDIQGTINVEVYDLNGRLMKKEVFESKTGSLSTFNIAVTDLNQGLYIVKVASETSVESFKLLKK